MFCCFLLGPGLLGREYNDLNVLSDSETKQTRPVCIFSSLPANGHHLVNRCHTKYTKSRFHYYSNSVASFNFELLRLSGDSPNPGLESCTVCRKVVAKNHRAVSYSSCSQRIHIKCGGISAKEYKRLQASGNGSWICLPCLDEIKQLPFADVSEIDTSHSSCSDTKETLSENEDHNNTWTSFDTLVKTHRRNVKIGHINANSIAGFKLHKIKNWLMHGRFDILAISETKLDKTYPDSQFAIHSFRMCRSDRNIYGGGLMIFVQSDLCFTVTKELEDQYGIDTSNLRIEHIILKVKVARSWLTVMAIYRPPSNPKSQWKFELSRLFEVVTTFPNDVICVGDFNSNLLDPKDSGHLKNTTEKSKEF